jgi:hypothetical protein
MLHFSDQRVQTEVTARIMLKAFMPANRFTA